MTHGIYALDTETTGVGNHPIHGHPQVIELASIPLHNNLRPLVEKCKLSTFNSLVHGFEALCTVSRYRPSMEIHKRAYEVHKILFKDLLGCPKSETLKLPKEVTMLIGHNIQYDYRCLGKPEGIKLICTLGMAKKFDKQFGIGFKNCKLDTLIIHFYGEEAQGLIDNSHQAMTDTIKVILLLVKLLEYVPNITTFSELYTFTESLKPAKKNPAK